MQGYISKGPNKPVIVVGKAQELLQFLNAYRGRLVLYRLHFLLIYLKFARTYYLPKVFHLRLDKFTFLYFSIQLLLFPLQY